MPPETLCILNTTQQTLSYINFYNEPTTVILQVHSSADTSGLYLYVSSFNCGQDTKYPG